MVRITTFFFLVFFCSCSPGLKISKQVNRLSKKFNHHSGFVLTDPSTGKTLINVNGDKYFTPASNTKILTLFAGITLLGDSIPAFRFRISGDSLIVAGTGDPSFLYQETFSSSGGFDFLKNFPGSIYLTPRKNVAVAYGPGWSWDDYDAGYQPERSVFPVYGNRVQFSKNTPALKVSPATFKDSFSVENENPGFYRERFKNKFSLPASVFKGKEINVPFITSGELTARMLSDTLGRTVRFLNAEVKTSQVLYSVPADSLYKTMMQQSDNLIAEQLLMMVSDRLTDTLDTAPAISRLLRTTLKDLPHKPVWVDGSGLSRYNQITPADITMVWKKILEHRAPEQIFPLLAASGRNGTLSSLGKGSGTFIYGKTGTLSNNYCLSGYLKTRSGRLLIFSSMNANFAVPARKVRDELENILNYIHERY